MPTPPPFVNITESQIVISCGTNASLNVKVESYIAGDVVVCISLPSSIPCFFSNNGARTNSICITRSFTVEQEQTITFNFSVQCSVSDSYWTNIEAVATDINGHHGMDSVRTQITC